MLKEDKEIPVSVKIDGDFINQHVAAAILESAIGKELEEAIEKTLNNKTSYSTGRARVFENIIEKVIQDKVKDLLATEVYEGVFRERIRKAVAEKVTDEVIGKFANRVFEARGF